VPPLVVGDQGHATGRRLIDYGGFADEAGGRVGLLVEAGAHWEPPTAAAMEATAAALLRRCGAAAPDDEVLPPPPRAPDRPRLAEVTRTVTATAPGFAFLRPYRGGEVVPERNTLIALDGDAEIRTPHDDCLLVMPSLRTLPGHTAVRLARFVEG
jgi:hypothetical protein